MKEMNRLKILARQLRVELRCKEFNHTLNRGDAKNECWKTSNKQPGKIFCKIAEDFTKKLLRKQLIDIAKLSRH
jgi:hypothetical protein